MLFLVCQTIASSQLNYTSFAEQRLPACSNQDQEKTQHSVVGYKQACTYQVCRSVCSQDNPERVGHRSIYWNPTQSIFGSNPPTEIITWRNPTYRRHSTIKNYLIIRRPVTNHHTQSTNENLYYSRMNIIFFKINSGLNECFIDHNLLLWKTYFKDNWSRFTCRILSQPKNIAVFWLNLI